MSETGKISSKVVSLDEALDLIKDGDTITVQSCGICAAAEEILVGLENRFLKNGHPRDLTLIWGCGSTEPPGASMHFAHEFMTKRLIVGHHGGAFEPWTPLIRDEKLESFSFPQGQVTRFYHSMAEGLPWHLSRVGLGTYMDPRIAGGRMNQRAWDGGYSINDLIEIDGVEYIRYFAQPLNICLIRGTTADMHGNISQEDECVNMESLPAALATRRFGGKVIVQVKRLTRRIHPKQVVIPGCFVDAIVVCSDPEKYHRVVMKDYENPLYTGDIEDYQAIAVAPMNMRKVVARRAAMELNIGDIINVGSGIPHENVFSILYEEGFNSDEICPTTEVGLIGGTPTGIFGIGANDFAMIRQDDMFNYYSGQGMDCAFLGAGEVDPLGNVNSTKMGHRIMGPGGFMDITAKAHKIVFCTTLTAYGLKTEIKDRRIFVLEEGKRYKFVRELEQISFAAKYALDNGQKVLYITERCVFELTRQGLMLTELAQGFDVEKDVLAHMEFRPLIAQNIKTIDQRIYDEGRCGIKEYVLQKTSLEREDRELCRRFIGSP